ncbi:MAG TPA: universal stress protein [Acidimicrobiales bacterium]|nr:universal stress protein [Acidimicrobiales bacterium]
MAQRERRIVVGVDGSENARSALLWAAAEARRRDDLLEVLYVYSRPPLADGSRPEYAEEAQKVVDAAIRTVGVLDGSVVAKGEAQQGNPAHVLIEASRRAAMLVVGSRGRGGFGGLLLGSVSHKCVGHAHTPVVVVRPSTGVTGVRRVVVGVDGSAHSDQAVRWAAEEAGYRNAVLRIVHLWQFPPMGAYSVSPTDGYESIATQTLAAAVDLAASVDPDLTIESETRFGSVVDGLREASVEAQLLVVGARGHGGFSDLLVGAVGQQCAHHAPCPVVIVRE